MTVMTIEQANTYAYDKYLQKIKMCPVAEYLDARFFVVGELCEGERADAKIPLLPNLSQFKSGHLSEKRLLLFEALKKDNGTTQGIIYIVPTYELDAIHHYDHVSLATSANSFVKSLRPSIRLHILKGSKQNVNHGNNACYEIKTGIIKLFTHPFYAHASMMFVLNGVPIEVSQKSILAHEIGHSLDPDISQRLRFASKMADFAREFARLESKVLNHSRFSAKDKNIAPQLAELYTEYVEVDKRLESNAWVLGKEILPSELHDFYELDRRMVETAHNLDMERMLKHVLFVCDEVFYG